jgi:large subunit ribosomal protein L4e
MPTKVWRNWHVKISVGQRRFATVAALAASAVPALVMARGHHVGRIPEIPLVVSSAAEGTTKTANAVKLLERFGAKADVDRVQRTMKIRPGKGKARNRKYNVRKGPLVIYDKDDGITRAFRNIPGVSLCQVTRLNLLELAPGGHVGRFIIWTEGAFKKLDSIWGTQRTLSQHKKGYRVPRSQVTNSDISRIISSAEIQSVIRAARPRPAKRGIKPNPLVNKKVMEKLNPFAAAQARASYSVAKAVELKKAGKKPRAHKTKKVKPAKPATAPKNPAKTKAHLQRVKKLRAANKAAFRARIQK